MSEAKKFKVGDLSNNRFDTSCRQMDEVSHVCHINAALAILCAGKIQPTLVFDNSKLNKKRILVAWLSPNYWADGFRYGNIRFKFSLSKLVKTKRYYWIESIPYKPPACRILFTDQDRDQTFEPYDPQQRQGPWWFDKSNGTHYFNGEICLELMIESSISLEDCVGIDFVNHHDKRCSMHRSSPHECPERGYFDLQGGAHFLTRAVVTGTDLLPYKHHFLQKKDKPQSYFAGAANTFLKPFSRNQPFSGATNDNNLRLALMRGVMSAYTYGRLEEAKKMATMFKSLEQFEQSATCIFAEAIGLNDEAELLKMCQ